MERASIVDAYDAAFKAQDAARLLPSHLSAIRAMRRCRTPDAGELHIRCTACGQAEWRPLSCGHRSCPTCQNHEATKWLDRQQAQLLPVDYCMVTFPLPYALRQLAWHHQTDIDHMLCACASSTLKAFGLHPTNLGADMGMTVRLHTHNRQLDDHPHVHAVVPGGGIDKRRRQWKKKKGYFCPTPENVQSAEDGVASHRGKPRRRREHVSG